MGHKENRNSKVRSSGTPSTEQKSPAENNTKLKGKLLLFNEKLKNHLSDEFIRLDDEKEELDHRMIQLQEEREQRDKTLFKNTEQKNVRKYFSPLLLNEEDEGEKNDKEKEFSDLLNNLEYEKKQLENKKTEIMELLSEVDEIINTL